MIKRACLLLSFLLTLLQGHSQGFENFITTSGHRLMDGDQEFRFISFNVPTLNFIEDEMAFEQTNPYALPTEFEMRDIFKTVNEMGGKVIRIYTIPVRNKNFPDEAPTYVEGPGKFNEEAFRTMDMMLSLANEYKVRIIFSLLNNWQWMGGRPNYADFRNKTADEFWTDAQLIDDFKKTIAYTLNRKNTLTGVKYKEDKAILCWETGNELMSPYSWTKEIAAFIKKEDKNHLLMDGYYAIDGRTVMEEAVLDPNIDIVSSHHYRRNPFDIPEDIQRNLDVIKGRKPYLIGEFGFTSTTGIGHLLDSIIENHEICGALIWSLRHHRSKGGFYNHSEPMGMGLYKAYRWPGFTTGHTYDERNLLQLFRRKAFEISEIAPHDLSIPEPPTLLPVLHPHSISWQGSTGASGYNVERSNSMNGPWITVGENVSDASVQYFPLFNDHTAERDRSYYYRIKALNAKGLSKPSNIVGPVEVKELATVDNMENYGTLFESKHAVVTTGNDRSFKEDIYRMAGDYGSEIIYLVPGDLISFKIFSYEKQKWSQLTVFGSANGDTWEPVDIDIRSYVNAERNYDYWVPRLYSLKEKNGTINYLKIYFNGVAQLGRVEIIYN